AYALLLLSFATAGSATPLVPGAGLPPWARGLVAAGIGLPLAARRLWPRAVLALVLGASLLGVATGAVSDSFVGAAFALCPVAAAAPRPRWEPTVAIGLVSIAGGIASALAGPRSAAWAAIPLWCAVIGGSWTVGRAVRERRSHAARSAAQLA